MGIPVHTRTLESISAELYGIHHDLQFLTALADACPPNTNFTLEAETVSVVIGRLAAEVLRQMECIDALLGPVFEMERSLK